MPNPITDVLWWINSEVDKLSGVGLSRVTEILNSAQAELANDLRKAQVLGTDDRYTAQVHRNALAQIEGALDHIKSQTRPEFNDLLRNQATVAGRLATSHLINEVQRFSSIFEHTVRPVALEAMSVIAEGKKTLWPRYANSAARYAGNVSDDIRKQLAIGVVKGETIDQLTRRLADHGGPKGLVYLRGREGDPGARAEVIAEGLFKRYKYWGERLARTEVVNAYNVSALNGMEELEEADPGYFKRWDAAVDGRTCAICAQYDDLVVPLKAKFPHGFDHPPRHPNCRCASVIWRKEWSEADTKDDLVGELRNGKAPGTVSSVPHKIQTPEPDYKAEAGRRMAKGGKLPPGLPESPPASLTRLPKPAAPKPAPVAPTAPQAPARRPRRSRAEVQAERQATELARVVRRSQQALEAMQRDEARLQRELARETRKRARKQARDPELRRRAREQARNEVTQREQAFRSSIWASMSPSYVAEIAAKHNITPARARAIHREMAVQADRARAQRLREARAAEQASKALERKQAREAAKQAKAPGKAIKTNARVQSAEDRANLAAVRKMKTEPMATAIHPSMEIAPGALRYHTKTDANGVPIWKGNITVAEASHAFAAPPGFRGVIHGVSDSGIQIHYFSTAPQTLKDGTVIPAGTKAATLNRDFYSKTEIHHSLFIVEKHVRSDGFADSVNGQAMLRYEKWGLDKISVDAAWVGRYKWAKMGFTFEHPDSIFRSGAQYIRDNIPRDQQAAYLDKLKLLVKEPWNLAAWDEGTKHPAHFTLPEGTVSRGEYPIGKAILLQNNQGMWSGHIPMGGEDPGYLNALRVVQASSRK